ncbi:two-component system activity regulator YycH [Bacillus sonorensis]|nr:two-component system activity regulator YycH [Bacillus sonorensis]
MLDYKHPSYVLGANSNPLSKKSKEIMNGKELIDYLREHDEYNFDNIEQIFPAYEMVSVSSEQDPVVKLVPTWCIKINGTVQPVSKEDAAVKEGAKNGVE